MDMRLVVLFAFVTRALSIIVAAPWTQSGLPLWCNSGPFLSQIGDFQHSLSSACVGVGVGPTNCRTVDNWWTPGQYSQGGQVGYCYIPGPIVVGITGPYPTYLYTSYYTICGGQPAVVSQALTDAGGNSYGKYYVYRDFKDQLWVTVALDNAPAPNSTFQPFLETGNYPPTATSLSLSIGNNFNTIGTAQYTNFFQPKGLLTFSRSGVSDALLTISTQMRCRLEPDPWEIYLCFFPYQPKRSMRWSVWLLVALWSPSKHPRRLLLQQRHPRDLYR